MAQLLDGFHPLGSRFDAKADGHSRYSTNDRRAFGILRKLLEDQRAHFKADAKAAKKFISVGDAKIDGSLDSAEAAAWASIGNALLNLDATIHR